ncbi:MAG: AAA family ATPase [Dehalococcoidia bacterium]
MSDDEPASDGLPDYVRGLRDPRAYPEPPDQVQLVQTHISYVFIAGDVVYKTKKPVDFGFINQTTLADRERFCHAEVRLNSRQAPQVYLGVAPVVRLADGGFAAEPPEGTPGEIVEWAVKMRRLPDDATLDRLLAAGQAPSDILERLSGALVPFHEHAARVEGGPEFAGAAGMLQWWTREYSEAEGYIGSTWEPADAQATRAFIDETLEREAALFDERLADGRVVEGHGDMQAKHVYVLGPAAEDLAIIDCIEFTEWFNMRYGDVSYDLAFLAMDLEAQGYPDLGDELAGRYLAATADETLPVLQPLHRTFRAFVRGKVESIGAHAQEIEAAQREALGASAARYFHLAAEYGRRRAAPSLVVLSGPSGTGKSLIGATLAARVGAAYVSSDAVRKRLAGLDIHDGASAEFREGLYTPEMTARTYEEMGRRAAHHLSLGRAVVLDGTHGLAEQRRVAVQVGSEAGVPALIVELRLTDDAALARIVNRERDPLRTSDAGTDVYHQQLAGFEPVTAAEGTRLALDSSQPPAMLAHEIAEWMEHPA